MGLSCTQMLPTGSILSYSSCQLLYFLRQCILNYASLLISTVAIFLNSRWWPDTMPVVNSTKFNMKLYLSKYMGAKFRAFVINIF